MNIDSDHNYTSSETIKKSIVNGLLCGLVTGYLGKRYSPNKASEGGNIAIFGSLGGAVCGVGTYFIKRKEDRERFLKSSGLNTPLYNYQDIGESRWGSLKGH